MKKYINERNLLHFLTITISQYHQHQNVIMSQDNFQSELDRAIASIMQSNMEDQSEQQLARAGVEDQPFDLEAFFEPLPDNIISIWDAEEARQARIDAEEHQIRQANEYTIGCNTPVLVIPSEEPNIMENGIVNLWADRMPVVLPEETITIASPARIDVTIPTTTIIPRKTRAECLAQRRPKRKTRAECLLEVQSKRGRRAGGDVSHFQDDDNSWLCEAAKTCDTLNPEDDAWLVAAAEECEPAILPPAPVIAGLVADTERGAEADVAEQRIRVEAVAEAVVVANHLDEVIEAVVGRRIEQCGGALDRTAPNVSYCDICNRQIRYCERDRHMQDFHGLHVCNRCGALSNSRAEFTEHKRICPQRPFAHYLPDSDYFNVHIIEALDGSILNYVCHPKRVSSDLAEYGRVFKVFN